MLCLLYILKILILQNINQWIFTDTFNFILLDRLAYDDAVHIQDHFFNETEIKN